VETVQGCPMPTQEQGSGGGGLHVDPSSTRCWGVELRSATPSSAAAKTRGPGLNTGASAFYRVHHGEVHLRQLKGCYLLLGAAGPPGSLETKPLCSTQQQIREALSCLLTLRIGARCK